MSTDGKVLAWAPKTQQKLQTPPLSAAARREIGYILRQIQSGDDPDRNICRDFKPAFDIGTGCYQIGFDDNEQSKSWRILYWANDESVFILEVYEKRTQQRPKRVTDLCKTRLKYVKEVIAANRDKS